MAETKKPTQKEVAANADFIKQATGGEKTFDINAGNQEQEQEAVKEVTSQEVATVEEVKTQEVVVPATMENAFERFEEAEAVQGIGLSATTMFPSETRNVDDTFVGIFIRRQMVQSKFEGKPEVEAAFFLGKDKKMKFISSAGVVGALNSIQCFEDNEVINYVRITFKGQKNVEKGKVNKYEVTLVNPKPVTKQIAQ